MCFHTWGLQGNSLAPSDCQNLDFTVIETSSAFPQGLCSLPLIISTDAALWNNSERKMTMHCSPWSLANPSPYLSSIILFWSYFGWLLHKYIFHLLPLLQVLFRQHNISFPVECWGMARWQTLASRRVAHHTQKSHGICPNFILSQLILLFSLWFCQPHLFPLHRCEPLPQTKNNKAEVVRGRGGRQDMSVPE